MNNEQIKIRDEFFDEFLENNAMSGVTLEIVTLQVEKAIIKASMVGYQEGVYAMRDEVVKNLSARGKN